MKTYDVKSPAKINIGLRVLSKRKDGFHNIETIFYPIKLQDALRISITPARKTQILVKVKSSLALPNIDNENNICHKAAKLFIEKFNIKENYKVNIAIKKNIPVGAGLGGGSSNAASVLKILAKHFKMKPSSQGILDLALELGSDVPFFLYAKPAYATGRGEKLIPLPKFKINYEIRVVNPGMHVSTAWAFKRITKNKKSPPADRGKKLNKISSFSIKNASEFVNDFEEPVFNRYPKIEKLKKEMYDKGAVFASMSGSGSSVYGFFEVKSKK